VTTLITRVTNSLHSGNAFLRSGQPSVDAFLERRPNFLGVGKLAIAYCLIPFEDEAKLYKSEPNRGGDWYEHLSVKLNTSFEEFGENKLSVITFNYDRSLEHYLLTSLQNLHGKQLGECANALAQIPIIHVYGQLGAKPYPEKDCHEYRPDRERFMTVTRAAEGITLLHEQVSDLKEAQKLLTDAECVCFLGFSYHPLNMGRLALKDLSYNRSVFGTARGLVGKELDRVHDIITENLRCTNVTLGDADNLLFLRQHTILGK